MTNQTIEIIISIIFLICMLSVVVKFVYDLWKEKTK